MKQNRYRRYSINLDDDSHTRCKAMADNMALSISGMLRILIREAFEDRQTYLTHRWPADLDQHKQHGA